MIKYVQLRLKPMQWKTLNNEPSGFYNITCFHAYFKLGKVKKELRSTMQGQGFLQGPELGKTLLKTRDMVKSFRSKKNFAILELQPEIKIP